MTQPLAPGATMPAIMGKNPDGEEIDIVASVAGHFAFLQFYRGHW